jgi:hypothetical protein
VCREEDGEVDRERDKEVEGNRCRLELKQEAIFSIELPAFLLLVSWPLYEAFATIEDSVV